MIHATLVLSVLLCSVATAERGLRGGIDPADLLTEIIDETNTYLIQNHLDAVDLPVYEHKGFLNSFDVIGGHASNFSTSVLVGEPSLNVSDQADGSSVYNFDMEVGMTDIAISAQFEAKLLGFLSFSGTVDIANTGNVVQATGAVISYSDSTTHAHNCTVNITSLKLKDVGSVKINIGPDSVAHWILEKISSLVLRVANPLVSSVIEHNIEQIAQMDKVKQIINTSMCRFF